MKKFITRTLNIYNLVPMNEEDKIMPTQQEIDKLPIISLEDFEKKVEEQMENNPVINRLINNLGSWENFPLHLIRSLFSRIGARPQINKY